MKRAIAAAMAARRKSLAAAVAALGIFPATAVPAQTSLSSQLASCLTIFGAVERLACYDRVARTVSGQQPSAVPATPMPGRSAPAPVARTAPLVPLGQPGDGALASAHPGSGGESFGSERLPQTASAAPARANEIVARIVSLSYDPRGRFTVVLDNGQVWRQLAGDTTRMPRKDSAGVQISRGALGSYDLKVAGLNASYKVSRVQ